ncbi:histidine kinase [Actinoplanes philippinensis]|uniref:Two-component system, NarL family, sensor histidine kinase DesK n=1 Tax=Actinoplanes philippinensis TaxID=35752 RepID=A0A1I1ZRK6_9ACTN|nr:sensor histidine kinase [Actinoplanes philippinensis]GIE75334.1 histidine kinase [Actinoplanes philippinensis]SFE34222.1 two-component system, NarL family, sensor histidine kinase DesK [Actinoplanes philippinensis]
MTSAPGTPRRGFRHGWVFPAIWLFYLGESLNALLQHRPGPWRDVGLAALVLFAIAFLLLTVSIRRADPSVPDRRATVHVWLGLLALIGLALLQVPAAGHHTLVCGVYVAAVAVMGLPLRQGVPVAVVLAVVVELSIRFVPGWTAGGQGYALAVLFAGAATGGIRVAFDRQVRLVHAQQEIADLAISGERARIAADLHDILGHSLTVVAVKAELAQRLLDVDVDRARGELRDLESLARDALADVRATALGMRGISLPGEIAAARAALAAANVSADLPGTADEVPTRNRELFAWTIREAVTNIVRHSRARHAEVRLRPDSVEIVDDGCGHGDTVTTGQGLAGLRRRAEEAGARLTAGSRPGAPGFLVRVEVPT